MSEYRSAPAEIRVARIITMLMDLMLQPLTRRQLSERYGVSERQITNDLAILRDAGVTISRSHTGYRAMLPEPGLPVLDVPAAARILDLSENGVRAAISEGTLPATMDPRGRWRMTEEAVREYERVHRRGRAAIDPSAHGKLRPDAVRAIRERRAAGEPVVSLAREFGVHPNTIYRAVHRQHWPDIG